MELGAFLFGVVLGTGVACIMGAILWVKTDRWLSKYYDMDEDEDE